jgi:hypothetical protein
MMHERYRFIKLIRANVEFSIRDDADFDKLLRIYFSRATNKYDEKELKKMIKVFSEKY